MKKSVLFSLTLVLGATTIAGAQEMPQPKVVHAQSISSVEKQIPCEGRLSRLIGEAQQARLEGPKRQIIEDQPEGTLYECVRGGWIYTPAFFSVGYTEVVGVVGKFVMSENSVYIYNPVGYPTETWAKADKQADGTYRMTGGEVVYMEIDGYGTRIDYALVNLKRGSDGWFYLADDQEISYTYKDEVLELVPKEDIIVGLIDNATEEWAGVGVETDRMVPVYDVENEIPEGLNYEDYLLTESDDAYLVKVAYEGDKVYVQMPQLQEKYAMVGTLADGKVTFADKQLICRDEDMGYYFYLCGVDATKGYNEEIDRYYYEFTMNNKDVVFDYDATTKTLTTEDDFAINAGKEKVLFITCLMDCKLQPWVERPGTPVAPEITYVMPYEESWGNGTIEFKVYCEDLDGNYLDIRKMYYKIYLDGEEYERDPEEHMGYGDPMVEIPLDYYDMNLYGGSEMVTFYFDFTGFDSMGIQSIYKGGGETHYSEIAYYYPAGVENIAADKVIRSEVYTDLMGRRVENPSAGLYIRTVTYADGSHESFKFVKR